MRILITGGGGCLGFNLVEHWLPLGHEILVFDNFSTSKREMSPQLEGLTVREGSIADGELVKECFSSFKPEIVIHAAASYKNPDDWLGDVDVNVIGSIHVAIAAKNSGVKRIINFQTSLCYGRPQQLPIPSNHPLAPFTSYAITKTAGEQFIILSGVPVLSLRLANVIGPRLAVGPIPTFYKRLKAGQKCFCSDTWRDFLDMSDFLEFMDLAIREDAPVGTFNLGTGEKHSVKEIFDLVADYLGIVQKDVAIVSPASDDVPEVVLDISDTCRLFGWKPKVGFMESIRRLLQWYDKHGIADIYSHLKSPIAR